MRIDFKRRELQCKIVVFGACAVGKTTILYQLARAAGADAQRPRMTPLDHKHSLVRYSALSQGALVRGLQPRFEWLTIPGLEPYPAAWRLLLEEADGILFVADSIAWRLPEAQQSLLTLRRIVHDQSRTLRGTPMVFAYNKQDLPGSLAPSTLHRALNTYSHPAVCMSAAQGRGVVEAAQTLTRDVLAKALVDLPRAVA